MKKYILLLSIIALITCKTEKNYEDDKELCKILGEMTVNDQKFRGSERYSKPVNKIKKDSIWKLQTQIDEINTKLLIDITKKRGWVSREELGCEEYIAPWVIFRHSPKKYWKEIRPLIEKEYAEKRMVVGDYMMIDNHLKGRPMIDFNEVLKEKSSD